MPTWKAYFQINGYDYAKYPVIDFPVPDDLYAEIQTALFENRPLQECPFYEKLQNLASSKISLEDYLPDCLEKPDPEEYDDEEEYQKDLTSYKEEREEYLDVLNIAECVIDDPNDLKRLNDRFHGLVFPEWVGLKPRNKRYENEECTRNYSVILSYDEFGAISELQVYSEGLVSEGVKSSWFESCYPDYKLITEELLKEYDRQNTV